MGSRCGICGKKQLEKRRKAKAEARKARAKKQLINFFNIEYIPSDKKHTNKSKNTKNTL